MTTPLRVLILADSLNDVELMLYELRQADFEPEWLHVETETDYLNHLHSDLDVILSNYILPQFDASRALGLLQEHNLDIPFIIITGGMSEEVAVACMKQGAADYLLKDRLSWLGESVKQALQQRDLHQAKQEAQVALNKSIQNFLAMFEFSPISMAIADTNGKFIQTNQAFQEVFGYTEQELYDLTLEDLTHPDDRQKCLGLYTELINGKISHFRQEKCYYRKNDQILWGDTTAFVINDADGGLLHVVIDIQDVTERKRIELELREAQKALEVERASLACRIKERTAELSEANAELARASRLKDEFLASMSHELRTPLNAILGLSEVLQTEVYGPINAQQRKSINIIEESGRHLLELINDILDLSKVEAGKLELDIISVQAELVCGASLQFIKQVAHKKQIKVSFTFDERVKILQADQRRLKQILVNLLSNAIKFTPEDGQIGLEVVGDVSKEVVHFTVWDTGVGIPAAHLDRVFQPFVQLDSSLTRQYEGTGLGLSLVYRLTEMHGGSVSVGSTVGQGSRFTVSLPWHNIDSQQSQKAEQISSGEIYPNQKSSPSQALILIVEDNETSVITVSGYLRKIGYRVVVARNGVEAIEQTRRVRPNLILMDVQMPGMDGLEAIRQIRKDAEFSYVPIIALTALAMPGDRDHCLAAGANEYLSKPVSLKKLVKMIEAQLGEHVGER